MVMRVATLPSTHHHRTHATLVRISKAFASLQAIPMENPPAWFGAKPITLFGDFEPEGDSFVAKCLIPGDCPDNGVCSLKAPAGGGQPNFSMARTRHIQKHHAAGKKRPVDPSTQLVAPQQVVVAPLGGALTQQQVDSLVALGVCKGIQELARLPPEMCRRVYEDLMDAGPEVRKQLIQRIINESVKHLFEKNTGVAQALLKRQRKQEIDEAVERRIADEEHEKESQEEDRKAANRAMPWYERFGQPIPAEEWDAGLLDKFFEHVLGFMVLEGKNEEGEFIMREESIAKRCQLPKLVGLIAGFPCHDFWNRNQSGFDAFLGRFRHPSGSEIELQFRFNHLGRFTSACLGKDYNFIAPDLKRLPHMEPMAAQDMPWAATPESERPVTRPDGVAPKIEPQGFLLRSPPGVAMSATPAQAVAQADGPLEMFLDACDASSRVVPKDDEGKRRYNETIESSEYLKLSRGGVIPCSTFRARYQTFCAKRELDFNESDISGTNLARYKVHRYIDYSKHGRELVTGFAEATTVHISSCSLETAASAHTEASDAVADRVAELEQALADSQARLKVAETEKYKAALALQATAAGADSSTGSGIAQDFDISSHRLASPDQN